MILIPVPIASHHQVSHDAPHFDHLDLKSVIGSLMMQAVFCDADASTYCMACAKKSCCTSFQLP